MEGHVPRRWKHSFITCIPKKPPYSSPQNYRPVSITSIFCRVFEKILKKRLLQHLDKHRIISDCQHGFSRGKSTETALLSALNDWTRAVDAKAQVHAVYFDFAKAFDKVPHAGLIGKLKQIGIHHRIILWIQDFLCNRTYQVRLGQTLSKVYPAPSGVPQGGVLSLYCFSSIHRISLSSFCPMESLFKCMLMI